MIERDKDYAATTLIGLLAMAVVEFAAYDANCIWNNGVTQLFEDVGAILLVIAAVLFISALYFLKRDKKGATKDEL
ncbi:hypothetical protein OZX56_05430 [Lactobacillus sp. ESL0684]|uniref:hypothetical protein n=1 Tax=Lactobacillus sp. ESL0684 TaxID=2983213 RepID=UPI0023F6D3B2|nr:hypothetical protein [Lactobacillus sp. ESL0684]WEV42991.1 hypothetical protein OZX56_05430 [Lactobacillus sp. ESL0684]